MTTHQLAQSLLKGPDLPAVVYSEPDEGGNLREVTWEDVDWRSYWKEDGQQAEAQTVLLCQI